MKMIFFFDRLSHKHKWQPLAHGNFNDKNWLAWVSEGQIKQFLSWKKKDEFPEYQICSFVFESNVYNDYEHLLDSSYLKNQDIDIVFDYLEHKQNESKMH